MGGAYGCDAAAAASAAAACLHDSDVHAPETTSIITAAAAIGLAATAHEFAVLTGGSAAANMFERAETVAAELQQQHEHAAAAAAAADMFRRAETAAAEQDQLSAAAAAMSAARTMFIVAEANATQHGRRQSEAAAATNAAQAAAHAQDLDRVADLMVDFAAMVYEYEAWALFEQHAALVEPRYPDVVALKQALEGVGQDRWFWRPLHHIWPIDLRQVTFSLAASELHHRDADMTLRHIRFQWACNRQLAVNHRPRQRRPFFALVHYFGAIWTWRDDKGCRIILRQLSRNAFEVIEWSSGMHHGLYNSRLDRLEVEWLTILGVIR